jgi:tRNA pseudouridine38-40 synthase
VRLALGVSYDGSAYQGWQSQASGLTVQDRLEGALSRFAGHKVSTLCAGRTDAGVHGLMQVVHLDTSLDRESYSWLRGTNTFLPADITLDWVRQVPDSFHCRACATSRRYAYILRESPTPPGVDHGRVGWVFRSLDEHSMNMASEVLIGTHDFSSFRAAGCQAISPIKTMKSIKISRRGAYWRFEFEADAFLHHMIRNIMGCVLLIGEGRKPVSWIESVLAARSRKVAAPTFSPDGLYFLGPVYDACWGLPTQSPAYDWLP